MSIQKEIDNLKEIVVKMCDKVVNNISDAIDYYLGRKEQVVINDDLIDQYERLVEEECINILIRERLFAKDLKEVTGILKLVSDLERIGDHAEDIVNIGRKLEKYNIKPSEEIKDLSIFVIKMIERSIKSYLTYDKGLAKEVINDDDFVDQTFLDVLDNLATKKEERDEYILFVIYTTLVVKYLERIADHSVNIAEWVEYICTGYYKDKMIL